MTRAYRISKTGDSKVLKLSKQKLAEPGPKEVRVKNHFVGVNHTDIHHRDGSYDLGKMPQIIGISGAGEIVKVGSEVKDFKVGEKVVYGTNFLGSYSEEVNIKASLLVAVDSSVSLEQAAAAIVPCLTAHLLVYRAYRPKKGNVVVVAGATGSVGHILCQLLSALGVEVIGLVGSDTKINQAKSFGCKKVLNYKGNDFVKNFSEVTNNRGASVVYDGIGKSLLSRNIDILSVMGILVNYGDTSGIIDKFDMMNFWAKSLFFTRPHLSVYKGARVELVLSMQSIFEMLKEKTIIPCYEVVDFAKMAEAHDKIKSGKVIGSLVARV